MASSVAYDDVEVGTAVPQQAFPVQRVNLIKYAGAAGDFNVIHWNERVAWEVGLPNVIAHGMFTMAQAARVVTDWVGDPAKVRSYSCRFTKPVPVPDDDTGTELRVTGAVSALDDDTATVTISAVITGPDGEDVKVLGQAKAVVDRG